MCLFITIKNNKILYSDYNIQASAPVVCKLFTFRSSKSNFCLQKAHTSHSSFEKFINPLNNKQMMLI